MCQSESESESTSEYAIVDGAPDCTHVSSDNSVTLSIPTELEVATWVEGLLPGKPPLLTVSVLVDASLKTSFFLGCGDDGGLG